MIILPEKYAVALRYMLPGVIFDQRGAGRDQKLQGETGRDYRRMQVAQLHTTCNTALKKLRQLDAAAQLDDLFSPGNRLEALQGNREGQYSIVSTISGEFVSGSRAATLVMSKSSITTEGGKTENGSQHSSR